MPIQMIRYYLNHLQSALGHWERWVIWKRWEWLSKISLKQEVREQLKILEVEMNVSVRLRHDSKVLQRAESIVPHMNVLWLASF